MVLKQKILNKCQGFLFLLCLCVFVFFALRPAHSVPFISEENELSMGKKADPQVVEQFGIYQDKSLQLYVNEIGQKLVSHLSDRVFNRYFFKLVDSSEINAFALPGGYVYVTRGLLASLNSEAELAGVLGHEIGHVMLHHGAKQIIRSIGAQIVSIGGAIASPKNAGQWLLVSSQMFQQINLGYGRDAELEADAQGMLNVTESGYNPVGMVRFLGNLRRQEIMSGQSYHSFQATHPDTKDRIIKADRMASSFLRRQKGSMIENKSRYLKKLQGMVFGGKRHRKDRRTYKPQYIDIYEVQPGDTFHSIAVTQLKDERKDLQIAVLNGKKQSDSLRPGEFLKLIRDGTYDKNKSLRLKPESP